MDNGPVPETPPPPSPGFLLIAVGRALREQADAALRADGLSLRHLSALGHLTHEPGLSYSELGRRAGVTAQSMQATLGQLEALDAVKRVTEPGRGRTARLEVTSAGRRLLTHGRAVLTQVEDAALAELSPAERGALTSTLLRVFGGLGPLG